MIPGWGRSPEEGMATHSGILAWEIPWTEEPGGLQSTRGPSHLVTEEQQMLPPDGSVLLLLYLSYLCHQKLKRMIRNKIQIYISLETSETHYIFFSCRRLPFPLFCQNGWQSLVNNRVGQSANNSNFYVEFSKDKSKSS